MTTGAVTRAGEDGAASMLAVAMIGVLVTVTVATVGVVGVVAGHRRAQAAADLAALAGAAALQDGNQACQRAASIAERNSARLRSCTVTGWDVAVEVVFEAGLLPGAPMELAARGRAGPVSRPG